MKINSIIKFKQKIQPSLKLTVQPQCIYRSFLDAFLHSCKSVSYIFVHFLSTTLKHSCTISKTPGIRSDGILPFDTILGFKYSFWRGLNEFDLVIVQHSQDQFRATANFQLGQPAFDVLHEFQISAYKLQPLPMQIQQSSILFVTLKSNLFLADTAITYLLIDQPDFQDRNLCLKYLD